MERAPERIGVAGDCHGNTTWATRAVRKIRADSGNWAVLDVAAVRWLRFQGRPVSNALRSLGSR